MPSRRIASRCSPRATTLTSCAPAASFAAMWPPTAPAPNMQSLMPIEYAAMKLCRFDDNRLGLVAEDGIRDVSAVLSRLPAVTYPFPRHDALVAHLGELRPQLEHAAVLIGARVRNVSAAEALGCVAGYCIGLDMTIRGPEDRSLRKSPDSYTVLGPWLVTADEVPDPGNLALRITVNGAVRQDAHTSDLILGVAQLIEWASAFYTLHPGDVILTGTPQGVGPVRPGDVMVATIERIGSMRVAVQ